MRSFVGLVVLFSVALLAQVKPQASPVEHGALAFGYSSADGSAVLALNLKESSEPRNLDRVIGRGEGILEAKFERFQMASPKSTNRNTADNFERDEGARFSVGGRGRGGESCMLASHEYLQSKKLVPLSRSQVPCDLAVQAKIPDPENRGLAKCVSLAKSADKIELVAVEYGRKGTSLLAAFVLIADSTVYATFLPAVLGDSAWRADDGGEFDPSYIEVPFALSSGQGDFEICIDWLGAEGDSLALYRTSQGRLERILEGYRYSAPS